LHLILLKIIMTLYIRNTEKLIIKFAHEQKFWLNYWVKKCGFKIEENKPYKCPACKEIFSGRKFKAYFAQPTNITNPNKWYIILLCDKCGEYSERIEVSNTTMALVNDKLKKD